MIVKRYCDFYDVDFLTAHSGAEVVKIIEEYVSKNEETQIKGIFMDCNMPIVDGYQVTTAIIELINNKIEKRNSYYWFDCKYIAKRFR